VNIAEAIVDSHLMLPATPGSNPQAPDAPD
jgi:hypothetical protein